MKTVKSHISKMGSFVLLTNNTELCKTDVLNYYRQKDRIEKIYDIVKNEMDCDRLRVHSQCNTEGRLFIKFLSLIIYMEISKVMTEKELYKSYTVKELLAEIKKLKVIETGVNDLFLSEMSKNQKRIFKAFDIEEDHIKEISHSY